MPLWGATQINVDYPDLSQLVMVLDDGASNRVCANLTDDPDSTAGWNWYERSTDYLHDFWPQLDFWLVHGYFGQDTRRLGQSESGPVIARPSKTETPPRIGAT